MRVILLKAVPKVGKPEEVVEVSEGFARNALFPRKLAIPATSAALEALTRAISSRATDKVIRRTLLDKAIEAAAGKSLVYAVPANEQGNLFSKIHPSDIAKYLLDTHCLDIDPKCIHIEEGTIKRTGSHTIVIKDGTYETNVTLEVVKK